ncbi:mycothiol-dependent nitroreductase Rv2466c family protein [Mycobacterium simiae]|uniref:mycothiol-dependent nitroreductase Rv2466c family protein n=1 Tax=Mycobacterium simiae TaxID=1784 RepID=UPI003F4CB1C3
MTLWLDPVCPFSWNTARWLAAATDATAQGFEVRLMSLAVLNEGRELPPPQQDRMTDSRRVGRLMAALADELGPHAVRDAYFAFADHYFDQSKKVDAELAAHVVKAVGAHCTTAAALDDTSYDAAVATSHQASQDAHGDSSGSPLLTIDDRTVFGPVLTGVPEPGDGPDLLAAVTALVGASEFSELSRPRNHP